MLDEINARAVKLKLGCKSGVIQLAEDEAPDATNRLVRRLDEELLIIDGHPGSMAASDIGVTLLLAVALGYAFWWMTGCFVDHPGAFKALPWGTVAMGSIWIFLSCFAVAMVAARIRDHLIRRHPSPVVFDRKNERVIGSHAGRLVALDWRRVVPLLVKAGRHGHLLVLFDPDETAPGKAPRRGYGIRMPAQEPNDWRAHKRLWAFVRCYMEAPPQALPPTRVTPDDPLCRPIEMGPYKECQHIEDWARRALHGQQTDHRTWPRAAVWATLWMFPLKWWINIYSNVSRPRVELPAFCHRPSGPLNPYRVRVLTPEEMDKRRALARWVTRVWWGAGVGTGGLLCLVAVGWGAYAFLRPFTEARLTPRPMAMGSKAEILGDSPSNLPISSTPMSKNTVTPLKPTDPPCDRCKREGFAIFPVMYTAVPRTVLKHTTVRQLPPLSLTPFEREARFKLLTAAPKNA